MDKRVRYMLKQNMSFFKNKLRYSFYRHITGVSDNMILFEAFGGVRYADSVRAIYEELISDERYRSFYFVWAFQHPEDYQFLLSNHHTILVRKGTPDYLRYYASSRYWINNVTVADYLRPSKSQIYIETWHGTPLKRLGCDIKADCDPRQSLSHMHRRYRAKGKKVSWFPSPSSYYTEKISSAFGLGPEKQASFVTTGYPRNDQLFHVTEEQISALREKYQIPPGKKVILYTPTWRDSHVDEAGHFTLPSGVDFPALMSRLGEDFILLFRAHHQIREPKDFSGCERIMDVSHVEEVNDLYLISDMMVTDYSSTMFDYANLRRPMIFHMFDRDNYSEAIRGFYLSPEELPGPITTTTEELAQAVLKLDASFIYDERYQQFNEKFNAYEDGHAARRVIDTCFTTSPHHQPVSERLFRYGKKNLNRMHLLYLIFWYNFQGFFRSRGLFHNNNSLRLERLKDSHRGERCFLIGNGPSLNGEDLNLLQEECTFGTNMVYKIFDKTDWRPTFHCVSDTIYASKLGVELSQMVKAPLFTTERTYRRMKKKPVNTTYVHTLQSERYKVRGNIQSYCMVKATVLSLAAEMAFHMGFTEIYLLGVDCTNPHGKGGHFTDNYTTKEVAETDINRIKTRMNAQSLTTEQIGAHIMDRSLEVYSLLNQYATKHGIRIYNATRGGNLEIFPRVKLEDIVSQK
ncbi:MAG: CDP-glycerol glycerophosphotransferase family protein [Lachnospiraceae bacterium]|nr:CDP-glycerol glycerophosphotransferase family protein [Lachnospiraceae bacterium]